MDSETTTNPNSPKEGTMTPDISIDLGTFADTTVTVTANTNAGRELFSAVFGEGAVSATLPKSRGEDFLTFAQRKGLRTN